MNFLFSLIFLLCCNVSLIADNEKSTSADSVAGAACYDVSKGFSSVVEKVLPAVVSVQATQVNEPRSSGEFAGALPHGRMGHGNPLEELFREFMGQMEKPRKTQAVGAGFIIHCDGKVAYVVTNHHVVSEAKTLTVVLEDKTEIPGTLLASDARNDVAVIKLDLSALPSEKRNLPTVAWANSEEVKTGDWVIAIGNPFNFGNSVTVGIVSHKGRYVPSGMQQDFEFIQHSAQINVGSSGGALFNTKGEVVGINNAIITNTGGNIGIGFAIPANIARQTVDQLVKYGKTRRGQLGIRIQAFDKNMAESQGMEDTGVIVGSVIDKGPADGKLEVGDIILAYEGKKVSESHILSRLVGETEIGKTVTLKVWRKGKTLEVKIKIEEMPDSKKDKINVKAKSGEKTETLIIAGLEIAEIPDGMKERLGQDAKEPKGVIVVGVDQNLISPDQMSVMPGDIIEEANGKELKLPSEFEAVVKKAKAEKRKNILLLISREGKPAYMPLRIDNADEEKASKAKKSDDNTEQKQEEPTKEEEKIVESNEPAEKVVEEQSSKKVESIVEPRDSEVSAKEADKLTHQEVQDTDQDVKKNQGVAKDSKNALESNKDKSYLSKVIDKVRSFVGNG